ncbi:terpenoid synthase [Paraphaeosphaeria sporulosa]|uniref:Terpenoid synthase n=1 Tax=Paraphaeosphaeria sporulosa TaxID=1460663 RepID=A0A177CSS4_9PLEO|nr:terpenoid synthase [Paraphaeosphaeria sporulosa]OAG09799.1 terpenoid synthase [Paraphaeosphaeria sporulosa]
MMKYIYSNLIPPSSYSTQGLCADIPLRCHRNANMDEHGTIRLRNDWQTHIGSLPSSTHGGRGPMYNFTSVTIPECLPERLEGVSYAMEFAFLHDDLVDGDGAGGGLALYEDIMRDIGAESRGEVHGGSATGEARILRSIMEEMSSLDAFRTKELLQYWKTGVSLPRDRTHFDTFEEYLDFRLVDSGALTSLLTGLMTFGMALTIPPEEKEECMALTRRAWHAAFLTNDVQSWEKECAEYEKQVALSEGVETPHMVNSVWVLMQQESLNVEEAIERVLEKVKGFVAEYAEIVTGIQGRMDLSEDSQCFVEAAQYMVSGNLVWGMESPRYHADRGLDRVQKANRERAVLRTANQLPTPPDEALHSSPDRAA